jgi:hypothetical protein
MHYRAASWLFLTIGCMGILSPVRGLAQEPDPRGEAPPTASSPNELAQPDEVPTDDDSSLATATPDPTPQVPSVLQRPMSEARVDVVEQAGVGGPVAYASAGVLEVGGSGSIFASAGFIGLRVAPFVTWFPFDGVGLSYIHELYGGSQEGDASFGMILHIELSLHLRVSDRVLIALGLAPGLLYNSSDWGATGRARAGVDVLVGRSGVFHPMFYFVGGSEPLVAPVDAVPATRWGYGIEITYGAMF